MLHFFYKMKENKKGFTLIELVVVIAILGILALIAIPRLANAQQNATRRAIETNLRTIDSAIMMRVAEGINTTPTIDSVDATDLVPTYIAAAPTVDGVTFVIVGTGTAARAGVNGITVNEFGTHAAVLDGTTVTGLGLLADW